MKKGSWIQNYPKGLERLYKFAERVFLGLDGLWSGLGYDMSEKLIKPAEDLFKTVVFECNECGQCVLHYTGMTCPMNCPKQLRNGPCGGTRVNGHCEVEEDMECVWLNAFERSVKMPLYGEEIVNIEPIHNWIREGESAWINMLREKDGTYQDSTPEKLELADRELWE
ncbi:MAG: hypothetical protein DRJ03_04460 [Chloroflexi bacterium]|nr:MAG: hypothetical protein B6I35_00765 [Anaerolineaceae bacterium 4572_32.2]RLC78288.1 MAG: hypothetical protein DRI81_07030 [Chloroflexota bacterium]RLC87934.1 MAG: hypothetical protein DRJ03_04460 [Chloroflexota bacterium]